jgi:hypothetical protein
MRLSEIKKIIGISLIFWLILFFSCNTASRKKEAETVSSDTIKILKTVFKRGVINNITSLNDPECSYSFYYPKDSLPKYPVLILLDPHAKGTYTVSLYLKLAEKYNIIILSSNNTRNQQSVAEIQHNLSEILSDAKEYLPMDTQKIFIGGFSGMARAVYEIGTSSKLYKGIVAGGAGIDRPLPWRDSTFCVIQMAGFKDMNFQEVYESSQIQKNVSTLYMSYFFDGEHTWPADSVMEFSFLNFFGNGHSAELAQFIKNNYTMAKKIPLRDNWKKILIYQSLRSLCFNQKYYVSPFNEMTNYINKYESKNAVKQLQTILASEKKEKSIMSNNFMDKDSLWWAKTIRFYKSIQNKKILSPADYKDIRVLNFIGLLSYSYTRNALQQNQMDMARKFLRIYQEADPYNSDMLYFWSVYFAKLNQSSRALDSLSKAVKLGFSDKSLAQSENSFLVLRDSLRFNDIVSRIK